MINFIQRLRNRLPKYKYDVWYNYSAHTKEVVYPIIFDEKDKYIDCKIGVKVIMGKTNSGKNIYYEVVGIRSRNGDWLYDSDSYKCKMKFSHIG